MTEISLYDMHIAAMKDSGRLLMSYMIEQCPEDEVERVYNKLAPAQMYALDLGCGRTAVAQIERRISAHRRRADEQRRANLKTEPYPSVRRSAFERVGAEPRPIDSAITTGR